MASDSKNRVCIVVLGDWGHSPRMQYHAMSLVQKGFLVDVVAYKGSEPLEKLRNNPSVNYHYMRHVPKIEKYFPKLAVYVFKTFWQSLFLFLTLMTVPRPRTFFVQNPPSVPTLPISYVACYLRQAKLMVDFHNYGFTILGLTCGKQSLLVRLYKWCEKYFAQKVTESLCVTEAMREDLLRNWIVRSNVFRDCPPDHFCQISIEEKHALFYKLSQSYSSLCPNDRSGDSGVEESTVFTLKEGDKVILKEDRPALLVSSTSWTEDEDFAVLLEALEGYDHVAAEDKLLPRIVLLITGKGPLKDYYMDIVERKSFKYVDVTSLWLKAEDYPKLLASADLGICLHKSSSGLDLPMKVVDMFGCKLPVCAIHYPCIDELVKHNINGLVFSDSEALADQLKILLMGFPKKSSQLQKYQKNLITNPLPKWESRWNENVLPLIRNCAQ